MYAGAFWNYYLTSYEGSATPPRVSRIFKGEKKGGYWDGRMGRLKGRYPVMSYKWGQGTLHLRVQGMTMHEMRASMADMIERPGKEALCNTDQLG